MEQGWVPTASSAKATRRPPQLWRLREGITESLARYQPYKNDVSVRIVGDAGVFCRDAGAARTAYPHRSGLVRPYRRRQPAHQRAQARGHSDDDFVRQCEQCHQAAGAVLQRHGGSISAEHGIGLVKKPYLDRTRSAAEIALMRGVQACSTRTDHESGQVVRRLSRPRFSRR
jgi:FAD/FMN-containing dehydrogenase